MSAPEATELAFPSLPLQEFITEVLVTQADELYWKKAGVNQAIFVRDRVHPLFRQGVTAEERFADKYEHPVLVVSTHMSKSMVLPVYRISHPSVTLTMRENFFNWMVSVDAQQPVKDLFYTLINRVEKINPVYCEGFKEEWVFESYRENPQQFTVKLWDEHDLWAFLFLLSTAVGIR